MLLISLKTELDNLIGPICTPFAATCTLVFTYMEWESVPCTANKTGLGWGTTFWPIALIHVYTTEKLFAHNPNCLCGGTESFLSMGAMDSSCVIPAASQPPDGTLLSEVSLLKIPKVLHPGMWLQQSDLLFGLTSMFKTWPFAWCDIIYRF